MIIIIGFIAIAVLTMIVCLMWAYTAIQVQKEQIIMERFYYIKLKQDQKCNVCGRKLKIGQEALSFKNLRAEHFDCLTYTRICPKCEKELKTLLDKSEVV